MKHCILFLLLCAGFVACETPTDPKSKAEEPEQKDSTEVVTKEAPKEEPKEAPEVGGGKVATTDGYVPADAPEADLSKMKPELATEKAPAKYQVKFDTTVGEWIVEVERKLAPNAADRFYNMVKMGYFRDIAIFRAVPNFMFQFGIHGNPAVNELWGEATFKDDGEAKTTNATGTLTFARTGAPDSRSTQLFINLRDNGRLDPDGFTPFGKVIKGMENAKKVNTEYGENRIRTFQSDFGSKGNAHAKKVYPNLTYIKSVTLVE